MIRKLIDQYKAILIILVFEIILLFIKPDVSINAWVNSFHFSLQVVGILPPVILLLGLLETWMPPNAIENHLGNKSGAKGMFLAVFLGSFAAGPLFAAFPVAASFVNKGGRIANTVIFLGAWATIKVPMLLIESRFLGMRFSLLRLIVTVPFIILVGVLMEKLVARKRVAKRKLLGDAFK
jgi:uncharacterized membrane protein YraQ (UPF0718 family)